MSTGHHPSRDAPHAQSVPSGHPSWTLRLLETPEEMTAVEALQRAVWPGSETDVVPTHLLLTVAHNGGLVMGAFDGGQLVGFVFGFPGLYEANGKLRTKHCSHMMGVHPDYRDRGLGFALKCSQRQVVRQQGLELITWTYDPLLSRNARLNIAKLGAVCNTYLRAVYGEMRDGLNAGLPSDRFRVDWWINSPRVIQRIDEGHRPRRRLADLLEAGAVLLNPAQHEPAALPRPLETPDIPDLIARALEPTPPPTALVEIPADFLALKAADMALGLAWRMHTRALFEALFARGFLVTDFIYEPGPPPRSFYILTQNTDEE